MTSWSGRWKSESVLNTEKKSVMIYPNGNFVDSKSLILEGNWTISDFLIAASQRLDIMPTAKRVFNSDGMEIDDCMMIEDNDILFISPHQDFLPPPAPEPTVDSPLQSSRRMSENLPTSIGGYIVGKFLGRGGFGEVRLGEHQLTGERVALKFLRKSDLLTMGAAERTATEIQCLTTMRHANIIRLQHHTESVNHVVLIFELMEGGDLFKYLVSRGSHPHEMALPEDEARLLFCQLINAVSYAHNQHICHRDLKLENILLKGPTLACVKIADFGLSDFYRPGVAQRSNCGTLSFQAPETLKSTASAGPPLDVWSLGVILFAVLCGRLPFEGTMVGSSRPRDTVIKAKILKGQYKVNEDLSVEAKDLMRRMLHIDASERASIPDAFNHCWLMSSSAHAIDTPTPRPSSFSQEKVERAARLERLDSVLDKVPTDKDNPTLDNSGGSKGSGIDSPHTSVATPPQASPDATEEKQPADEASPSFKLIPLRRHLSQSSVDDDDFNQAFIPSPASEIKPAAEKDSRKPSVLGRMSGSWTSGDGLSPERDSIDALLDLKAGKPFMQSPSGSGSRKRFEGWDSSTSTRDLLGSTSEKLFSRSVSTGGSSSSSSSSGGGGGVISSISNFVGRAFGEVRANSANSAAAQTSPSMSRKGGGKDSHGSRLLGRPSM